MQNLNDMTPEERFQRIENLLEMSAAYLAKHDEAMAELNAAMARNEAEIEKHAAAIRDLIVVSRTVLEAQKETTASMAELRATQKAEKERLNILVATVDRIIGNLGK